MTLTLCKLTNNSTLVYLSKNLGYSFFVKWVPWRQFVLFKIMHYFFFDVFFYFPSSDYWYFYLFFSSLCLNLFLLYFLEFWHLWYVMNSWYFFCLGYYIFCPHPSSCFSIMFSWFSYESLFPYFFDLNCLLTVQFLFILS